MTNAAGVKFGVWKNSGALLVSTGVLPTTGAWHHVAYTLSGGGITNMLYVDGVQSATSTTATDTATPDKINAGRSVTGANFWLGRLDEIRIYTRALTAAEISSLAQGKQ